MSEFSVAVDEVRGAVIETAQSFHLSATTSHGESLLVPVSYQIREDGFRPYRAGKASATELQQELDLLVDSARESGVDLGIEGVDSVRKLMVQQGLGIDCSNFAFQALSLAHERLDLPPYTSQVYRNTSDVAGLVAKGSWLPKTGEGLVRDLTDEEADILASEEENLTVSVEWVCSVFGKDPEFITGSSQITAPEATVPVGPTDLVAGDLVAFHSVSGKGVSHVTVVEDADVLDDVVNVAFWHSWHTRDFESGLRRDTVRIHADGTLQWSHQGLGDPERYQAHTFRRPAGLAVHYASLAA